MQVLQVGMGNSNIKNGFYNPKSVSFEGLGYNKFGGELLEKTLGKDKLRNLEAVLDSFYKKLKADSLYDAETQTILFRAKKAEQKVKSVPAGYGITGIKKQSSSPYVPTEFNYGTLYREEKYYESHINMSLASGWKEVEAYMNPEKQFRRGFNYNVKTCDFVYNNSRTPEQIAQDLYNTYKYLRYEKFYKNK